MPKRGYKTPLLETNKRTRRQKTKDGTVTMTITAQAQKERQETVGFLVPRERTKVSARDVEFKKLLAMVYRENCPDLPDFRPRYRGVPEAVIKECIGWIYQFPGVQKKTSDPDVYVRHYDKGEGQSWVDQRRSKHLIPLFLHWLDVVKKEVARIRKRVTAPQLVQQVVVQLLTITYHPQSTQSNQTPLICVQSLTKDLLKDKLKKVAGIDYLKGEAAAFVVDLRERGIAALRRTRRTTKRSVVLSDDSDATSSEMSESDGPDDSPDISMALLAENERLRRRLSDLENVEKQRDAFAMEIAYYRRLEYRRQQLRRAQYRQMVQSMGTPSFQNPFPMPIFDPGAGLPPVSPNSSSEPPPSPPTDVFGGVLSSSSNYADIEMSDASSIASQRSSVSPLSSDDSYCPFLNDERLGY